MVFHTVLLCLKAEVEEGVIAGVDEVCRRDDKSQKAQHKGDSPSLLLGYLVVEISHKGCGTYDRRREKHAVISEVIQKVGVYKGHSRGREEHIAVVIYGFARAVVGEKDKYNHHEKHGVYVSHKGGQLFKEL